MGPKVGAGALARAAGNVVGGARSGTHSDTGGNLLSNASARWGRGNNWPPQLGQSSNSATQSVQKVHSKEQM